MRDMYWCSVSSGKRYVEIVAIGNNTMTISIGGYVTF